MTDTRVIRPADAQEPLPTPDLPVVIEWCTCTDAKGNRRSYRYRGTPDPVLIGDWRRVHERCEG